MSDDLSSFLKRWVITTLAVLVAANIVPGIHYDNMTSLVLATLLLGILNAIARPLMILFSLPLVVFSLGLFVLVINAALLYWVGRAIKGFHVDTFWAAFWGSVLIGFVSMVLNALTGGKSSVQFRRGGPSPPPPRKPPSDDGGGPVIDV